MHKVQEREGARSPSKDAPDHFLDRDFLDVYVGDGQFVQQGFANRNDSVALDLKLDSVGGLFDDLAVFAEILGRAIGSSLALDGDELGIGETIHNFTQAAIEENRAVINDDHALAQFLDVGHVMAGKQDGGLVGAVVPAQELADDLLRNDVQ